MLPVSLSIATLVASVLVGNVGAVNLTIPTLLQCEPATFTIEARGNVTIGVKDASRMSNVMRAFVPVTGTANWTWDKVELPSGETAIFLVTDFFGSSPFDTALHFGTAVVGPSPSNNTACLPLRYTKHSKDDDASPRNRSIEVPVIVGVLTGFLGLLLGLVVLVMLRRRRERLSAEKGGQDDSSAGDGQNEARRLVPPDYTPAGGGYMAKLVPGLQILSPVPPAPSSSSPAGARARSGRRRNFRTWRRTEDEADGELPSYGESMNSRVVPPGYSGFGANDATGGAALGQAFELNERRPPVPSRMQTTTSMATAATELEDDYLDNGDGWGGRNSIFGGSSIGLNQSLHHQDSIGRSGGGGNAGGGTSLGGGSSFNFGSGGGGGGYESGRSIGGNSSVERIEALHIHQHDHEPYDEEEPVTSPLLPRRPTDGFALPCRR